MSDQPIAPFKAIATSLLSDVGGDLPGFETVFGNTNPVEIEIGCGKGKFLIARAAEHLDINFLGVDVAWKWMKHAVRRTDKRGLDNIRFIKRDAGQLIRHEIKPESVDIFHVYFPDPWPKRRHRKRRLVTGDLLHGMHERLVPGGRVEIATDHDDYYQQMRAAVVQSGVRWKQVTEKMNHRLFTAYAKTNYETKYEMAGRTLHYLELQKTDGDEQR